MNEKKWSQASFNCSTWLLVILRMYSRGWSFKFKFSMVCSSDSTSWGLSESSEVKSSPSSEHQHSPCPHHHSSQAGPPLARSSFKNDQDQSLGQVNLLENIETIYLMFRNVLSNQNALLLQYQTHPCFHLKHHQYLLQEIQMD